MAPFFRSLSVVISFERSQFAQISQDHLEVFICRRCFHVDWKPINAIKLQ